MRYIHGETNVIDDALSRACCMESPSEDQSEPVVEVNAITSTLFTSLVKLEEIQNYTSQDIVLSCLKDVIH